MESKGLYYPNSVSTLNLTRLIVSGDISVNPGPDDFQFIPSRISDRRCCRLSNACRRQNIMNLTEIKCVTSAATPIQVQLTLCTLNARSLRNKSALFFDFVCDRKADVFAITETWLSFNDSAVCKEITPAGYKFAHCPRSDRVGGGIGLLFKDSIHVSNIASGSKLSFEFAEYLLSNESLRFRLAIVYRPPYSSSHLVTISTFLEEFAVYLESIILSSEALCLTGDFNVHVDDPNDSSARCFRELLESMPLTQHVNVLTHDQGHTLDLVITRNSDSFICGAPFTDFPISDHLPVVCSLRVAKPPSSVSSVPVRKPRAIDPAAFKRDINDSDLFHHPSDNLEELVLQFHDTLRALLDRYAPVKRKQIRARPSAPWMTDEIRYAKRQKRKAERRWRASKTPTNLALFLRREIA